MPQDLPELLQRCTVKLRVPSGHGTGFFVAPGLILTCAHVLAGVDAKITVCWQGRENFAEAIALEQFPDPFDLALLRYYAPIPDLPCVSLDDSPLHPGDRLYSYGYPIYGQADDFPHGCPVTCEYEGLTGDFPPQIKFKAALVRRGLSGSPLLNLRTGTVCGIVKFSLDSVVDIGGGAIPTAVIFSKFPELKEQNRAFHAQNRDWSAQQLSLETVEENGEILNEQERDRLVDLLLRASKLYSNSRQRKSLIRQVGLKPGLFELEGEGEIFVMNFVSDLVDEGNQEVLQKLCQILRKYLGKRYLENLDAIQRKLE